MFSILSDIRRELLLPLDRLPVLIYAIAAGIVLTPISLLGNGIADVVISTVAALFIVRTVVQRDAQWIRESWIAIGLVLWIYLTLRGIISIDPARSGLKGLSWIRFIVFGAAVHFALITSPSLRKVLLFSIVAMAAFGASDALYQAAVGHDIFGRPKIGVRLTGPLRNPAIGTLILIAGLPASFYLTRKFMLGYREGQFRWLSAAILILMALAIIFSGERMALLLSFFLAAIIALIFSRSFLNAAVKLALFAASVVAILSFTSPELQQRQLSTLKELSLFTESIYIRAMLAGVEVTENNPVFGVGLKNFQMACPSSTRIEIVGDACRLIHPHQVWLHIASETGLVGVVGFLSLFVLALGPAVSQWRTWAEEPLLAGTAVAVLIRLLPFTTSGNFFSNWRESFFWFLLGTAAAMGRVVSDEFNPNSSSPSNSGPLR